MAITLAPEDKGTEVFDSTTGTVMFPMDQALENELNSMGVAFERKTEFTLAAVERRAGTQVRDRQNQAPRESVDRYTAQLAEGALFPPIVVQSDPAAPEEPLQSSADVAASRSDRSQFTQNDADPKQDMTIIAPESLLSFCGEVKQQVLAVRSQLVVLPHRNVGPTHLPALQ